MTENGDMPIMRTFACTLAAALTPAAAIAQAPAAGLDCMIQPHQIVQVGSPAAGVIERIAVERGDFVQRGQPIVQLNANVERAALAVARERAQQQGEVKAASGTQELARRELERANELYEQNFVSKTYLDKQRAEAQVAGGRTDSAHEKRKLSSREVELAAAQLEQRTIRAPIAGVVVERFMSPGEYVDQKPGNRAGCCSSRSTRCGWTCWCLRPRSARSSPAWRAACGPSCSTAARSPPW